MRLLTTVCCTCLLASSALPPAVDAAVLNQHPHPPSHSSSSHLPRRTAVTPYDDISADADIRRLDRRKPAQFWAGWPKTTVTLIATVTQSGNATPAAPSDTDVTTTIYDTSTGSPSGTLTLYSTTTVIPVVVPYPPSITTTYLTTTSSSSSPAGTRVITTTTSTLLPSATYTPALPDNSISNIPRFATCNPGDENYKEPGGLNHLTEDQRVTLAAIGIMFFVILIGWNFVVIRYLLYPLKMVVLFIHEGGHAIPGVLGGVPLERVYTDPVDGGLCTWNGAWPRWAVPLGYLASILVGCTFIMCGFNTEASKVASFFIGILLLLAAYQVFTSPLGLVLVAANVGLLIALWFIRHAQYLRFFVLFVGVMSTFYLVWDFLDDWVFHKLHPCCLILHRDYLGFLQPFIWLYIWTAITAVFFTATILLAIAVFRQSPHSMFCQGQSFLPT